MGRKGTPIDTELSSIVVPPAKYQLRLDFQQQVSMDKFGDEIMDQPLGGVTMRKLMGVSSEFNHWVCEHGRRKRKPVDSTTVMTSSNATTFGGSYYACPSGRARVVLNKEVEITDTLLDSGFEVNLMPEWLFKQTSLPIDTDID